MSDTGNIRKGPNPARDPRYFPASPIQTAPKSLTPEQLEKYKRGIENTGPHRCNPRMDDFLMGVKKFRTQGSFGRLVRCLMAPDSKRAPIGEYAYMDADDVDRSLKQNVIPDAFYNIKRGYKTNRDMEIMHQFFKDYPEEEFKRGRNIVMDKARSGLL